METSWRRKGCWENPNGGEQYIFSFLCEYVVLGIMCQEETSERLEGEFPGGVINHGKNLLKRFDSFYKL